MRRQPPEAQRVATPRARTLGTSVVCAAMLAIVVCGWRLALPASACIDSPSGRRVHDRHGVLIAETRTRAREWSEAVTLSELSPAVVPALLAAEDERFEWHPGLDPLAIARALAQSLSVGRVVSGASTITQQLARSLFERPKSLWGKVQEAALALDLERRLSKAEILEAYLNGQSFGPGLRGIAAASRHYFDAPASTLTPAQAATLIALLRGPTFYSPRTAPARLEARRNWVLQRMGQVGALNEEQIRLWQASPLELQTSYVAPGGVHFVRSLLQERLGPGPTDGDSEPRGAPAPPLKTTLDARLQAALEASARSWARRSQRRGASALAALVMDNATAEIRAYVGSANPSDTAALGQNDGVLARRSPGSTLKPFLYALGMERLGMHGSTLLDDLPLSYANRAGRFTPHNYDERHHGPVRLREALAGSLNVPAVELAHRLGPEAVLAHLHDLGFVSLDRPATDYGEALVLGSGEVRLLELVAAYATLARGGRYLAPVVVAGEAPSASGVIAETVAAEITDILADRQAGAATFGRGGALEFEFPVALKTGTSKGYRDSWIVGYTSELTVGVWLGNFDGSPTERLTGAAGAGVYFQEILPLSHQLLGLLPGPLPATRRAARLERVCALSGDLAGPACPHAISERRWVSTGPGHTCSWHVAECSPRRGRSKGDDDTSGETPLSGCTTRLRLPPRFAAYSSLLGSAQTAPSHGGDRTRDVAAGSAPTPSEQPAALSGQEPLRVLFPSPESHFVLDHRVDRAQQRLGLLASGSRDQAVTFVLDEEVIGEAPATRPVWWSLRLGRHTLVALQGGERSRPVTFRVSELSPPSRH